MLDQNQAESLGLLAGTPEAPVLASVLQETHVQYPNFASGRAAIAVYCPPFGPALGF
jgi:hypothetical protein